jgi:hypothetical protein
MISNDVLAQIAALTNLTAQDIEDLRACDPNQLATLMRTYEDAAKVSSRGLWVQIGNILKQAEDYAPLGSLIISIIGAI